MIADDRNQNDRTNPTPAFTIHWVDLSIRNHARHQHRERDFSQNDQRAEEALVEGDERIRE